MTPLKYFLPRFLINLLLFAIGMNAKAQDTTHSTLGHRNVVNLYVGIVEYNLSYERNILQNPKSLSNVRLGFGHGQFLIAGEGQYINAALVHLIGKMNSHLEINLGIKYMLTNSIDNPTFAETFIPDVFLGYRFEKPSSGLVFRIGLNYPTLINLGIGYKF